MSRNILDGIRVPEIFRYLAAQVAQEREREYGAPCLAKDCPHRQTKCGSPASNVVPFRPTRG